MIKSKSKYWYLSDFEETSKFMFIVLDKEFHRRFYWTAIDLAGGQRKLGKILYFYSSRINNYLYEKRRPSLSSIMKLSNFLVNNGKAEFNINEVEKHIIKIKVNGQPISIAPKFPIALNENLVSIVAHIIGDGGINKYFDPFYSNGDLVLLNNFKKYMKNVFGCDALREHGSGSRVQIWYPRIVGKMLIEMFGPFSFGRNPKYVPSYIINIDKELKVKFLNSLYGDEGSTSHYQVSLYQGIKNLKLLHQIKSILNDLNIKTNDIQKIRDKHIMVDPHSKKEYLANEMYTLTITGYKEINKFKNNIGFPIGSVKEKNFLRMFKNKYTREVRRNKVGETKNLILNIIANQPKTINEIYSSLGFLKKLVYHHIQELKSENKVLFEDDLVKLKR